MALELTHQQLQYIKGRLSDEGLHFNPLEEELLDHLCCAVEEKMASGTDFYVACEEAISAFGKDGIQKLQLQTIRLINQKSQRMKIISLATIIFFGGLLTNQLLQSPTVAEEKEEVEIAIFETDKILDQQENDPPSIQPLKGQLKVSSAFGMRKHPVSKKKRLHKGIDLRASKGTPVLATASGTVSKVRHHKRGWGKHIYIKHDDTYTTFYAHLSEIKVAEGQQINKGTVIGLVGNSGVSTAPHLHYGVLKDGQAIDPAPFLNP